MVTTWRRRGASATCALGIVLAIALTALSAAAPGGRQPSKVEQRQPSEDRAFAGRYAGRLFAKAGAATSVPAKPEVRPAGQGGQDVGLEVTAGAGDAYTAVLYYGGLPEKASRPTARQETLALTGTYRDFTLVLTGKTPLRFQYIHGRFTILDDEHEYRGHLARVIP